MGDQTPLVNRSGASVAHGAEGFTIKCGRCSVIFSSQDCGKLEHFSIYRVVCPHCGWPGRYLASELHAAASPTPRRKGTRRAKTAG
jgi:predicted RNA-binding Zn-ribbon protein involved in translation (DUF1610 family)